MNVIHVITSLGQGGAEAMLEKLIGASQRVSPEIRHSVVSLRELDVVGPRLLAKGVDVIALGMGGRMASLRGMWRLMRILIAQPRHTVVQTWLYHADLIGGLTARLCGLQAVCWNLRGVYLARDLGRTTRAVARVCALLSSRIPARIICCGPVVMRSHERIGYSMLRGVVLSNGFEPGRFEPSPAVRREARAALGVRVSELLIGTVARLHPLKDYAALAEAARVLAQTMPHVRFLWIGAGIDTDAALDRVASAPPLQGRVLRLGSRDDIPRLLNAMDVFCLPSRGEGFPNAVGEAMACGLPCVATGAGDTEYVLGDPRWIVPTGAPEMLASRLRKMLDLPTSERLAIGARNRERVAAEFDIDVAWSRYLNLYRELVPRDSATGTPS